jgi:hypothetical protein
MAPCKFPEAYQIVMEVTLIGHFPAAVVTLGSTLKLFIIVIFPLLYLRFPDLGQISGLFL